MHFKVTLNDHIPVFFNASIIMRNVILTRNPGFEVKIKTSTRKRSQQIVNISVKHSHIILFRNDMFRPKKRPSSGHNYKKKFKTRC
jgi:hypothetical protein